ncbi:MAG: hypothetical protein QX193_00015 [Methylococcales bacterium]
MSAFLIAVGGAAGTLFRNGEVDTLFWFCVFLMAVFIFVALVVIRKIKQKKRNWGVMMALLAMIVIGIAIAGMFLYLAETI